VVVDRKLIKRANIKLLILHKSLITYASMAGKNNKLILPPPYQNIIQFYHVIHKYSI
jgi:hypothetical protein